MKRQLWHLPIAGKRIDIEWLFEPRDWWVGVFVDERSGDEGRPWMQRNRFRHIYLCLVPCFPLHVWWYIGRDNESR